MELNLFLGLDTFGYGCLLRNENLSFFYGTNIIGINTLLVGNKLYLHTNTRSTKKKLTKNNSVILYHKRLSYLEKEN